MRVLVVSVPVGILIARAYPPIVPIDMVGLPDWAMSERYDVSARSPLQRATPQERAAMTRAMLSDRFKLQAHTETREQDAYDLALARRDGQFGHGLRLADASIDCEARAAAAAEGAAASGQPPPARPAAS